LMMIVLVSLARHPLDTVISRVSVPGWVGGVHVFLPAPTRAPPSLGGAPTRMPSPLPPRARPRAPCVRVVVVHAMCARFLCRTPPPGTPPARPSCGLLQTCAAFVWLHLLLQPSRLCSVGIRGLSLAARPCAPSPLYIYGVTSVCAFDFLTHLLAPRALPRWHSTRPSRHQGAPLDALNPTLNSTRHQGETRPSRRHPSRGVY
jgi:hypothetical protein